MSENEMEMSLPFTLEAPKKQFVVFMIVCVALASLFIVLNHVTPHWGWLCGVLLCVAVMFPLAAQYKNPPQLRLTETGFTMVLKGKVNKEEIRWKDIECFGTIRSGMNHFTSYRFNEASGKPNAVGGYVIAFQFGFAAEDLAAMLECLRNEFSRANANEVYG